MPHVFAYGSLMFDAVWSRVVSGSYYRCEALLPGYDRKAVMGDVYPVLFPAAPGSQVQGIIYLDVTSSDLDRLDRFEGEYYLRKSEQAVSLDMQPLPVEVYVLKEEYYTIIAPADWDPVEFNTTGIHIFMQSYMNLDEH